MHSILTTYCLFFYLQILKLNTIPRLLKKLTTNCGLEDQMTFNLKQGSILEHKKFLFAFCVNHKLFRLNKCIYDSNYQYICKKFLAFSLFTCQMISYFHKYTFHFTFVILQLNNEYGILFAQPFHKRYFGMYAMHYSSHIFTQRPGLIPSLFATKVMRVRSDTFCDPFI